MKNLTVGITGMIGFMGSHLRDRLVREENISVPTFEDEFFNDPEQLRNYLSKCDSVVHLAAMNRGNPDELYKVNIELVTKLVSALEELDARPNVIFSSSTQINRDNPYGKSKKEGARILTEWATRNNVPLTIMVIPNVFGDSGQPFYNSVVATFCYQITHDQQPKIEIDGELNLIYINELVEIIAQRVQKPPGGVETMRVNASSKAKVSEILTLLRNFKKCYFDEGVVPKFNNDFERNLYNTFLTYMDDINYERHPVLHSDDRGSLFEVVKQDGSGQIFFSTTRPDITRGNHYHTRKMEKFCVVRGQAVIRMRRIGTDEVIEYKVSGDAPSVVEMPIFYTHNITNVGQNELLTLFWTNELFDPEDPDTFYEEV
ncbi:MAG: polysaccharide biosynthesis C-terminal domain-containing protein [Planctomycetota bacterium]|jgi:UDP-2-acetamido-2,6-beta-L-arabino-hexul-4-ose reductase